MKAIILAAGVGHRLHNLTRMKNKAFLSVAGMPIIEQMIRYLLDAGIQDIVIVTGHCHDSFISLMELYPVRLIYNRYYSVYNSLYSLELALCDARDTFVIHGDVALFKNIFQERRSFSYFYTVLTDPKGMLVRHPVIGKNRHIDHIELCRDNKKIKALLGVFYLSKHDVMHIMDNIRRNVSEKMRKDFYGEWIDYVYPFLLDRIVEAHQIDRKYAVDINTVEDYFEAIHRYETYWKKKK